MAIVDGGESETVLADLELTRGLTIQMTALGTLGLIVAASLLAGLYQALTGQVPTFQFGPASVVIDPYRGTEYVSRQTRAV